MDVKISRQLLRKLARQGIDRSDIDSIIGAAVESTILNYEAILVLALHDKLGFGEKRAKRFIGYLRETFDAMTHGYVNLDEIKEEMESKLDIDLSKELIEGW